MRPTNWQLFEQYNALDAKQRIEGLKKLGINCSDANIVSVLTKSHFVIPGKTKHTCQQCGECCRYARKLANFTYDPCPFLTEKNTCSKHSTRYLVCKWFPFFIYNDPKYGELLTIKPYCSGYGKGAIIEYQSTIDRIKKLETQTTTEDDGAFVIHELLYLPEKKEWVFPSRPNLDQLLRYIAKSKQETQSQNQMYIGELHYAQHFTNGLLGGLNEPQLTINEHFQITDINEAFVNLFNQSKDYFFKKDIGEIFSNSEAVKHDLANCLTGGRINAVPEQLMRKDGTLVPVFINGLTYRDRSDGLIHGIIICLNLVSETVYRDMTHSRSYARGLLEASLDLLVVLDKKGIITDVNQTCCDLLGREREKITGTLFRDYFDNPETAELGIELTYQMEKIRNYELNLINSKKETIPVSFNASVFKDSQGAVIGIFAAARDIRETKKLMTELENAQHYSRSLIESSLDLMVTINRDGIITDVNEAACQLTGSSREELVNSRFSDYFEDSEKAYQGVCLTFEQKKVSRYELTLLNKKRERIEVSFNASIYCDKNNNVIGVFAIARDIRERLKMIRELQGIKNPVN